MPGDAVVNIRLSEKFAFVECRTIEEANNLLLMDSIPYMGVDGSQNFLRINRPSKYAGPITPTSTWDQTYLRYAEGGPSTQVVRLGNMVTNEDLASPDAFGELLEDTEEMVGAYRISLSLTPFVCKPYRGDSASACYVLCCLIYPPSL